MKKHIIICSTIISGLALSFLIIFHSNNKKIDTTIDMTPMINIKELSPIGVVDPSLISNSADKTSINNKKEIASTNKDSKITSASIEKNPKANKNEVKVVKKASLNSVASNNTSSNGSVRLSRGGSLPKNTSKSSTKNVATPTSSKNTYSSKVEVLDWKTAKNVFSRNTVAEVTDVYTKKTFKVKRTMGTNHADTEALTIKDTEVIKGIWGGFSWERRPVILHINGRKLAASMSAMPHAGIDSAPAFKVINNRSEGYGRGQNLDVVKGNGMDGHFDIHFLNSTRHKDGKKDPQHQAAILKAAK